MSGMMGRDATRIVQPTPEPSRKTCDLQAFLTHPRGFEPLTFGSLDAVARDWALLSHFARSDAPRRRLKIGIAGQSTSVSALDGGDAGSSAASRHNAGGN